MTYLYLTFIEFLVDGYPGTTGEAAWVRQVLVGHYWFPFWVYVVGGGLLPLLLLGFRRTRTVSGVVTASTLVVVTLWIKRLVIVIPPTTQPLVTNPLSPAGWGTYHFTWVAVTITLAGLATIPLLLMLLFRVFRVFPILPVTEMEEIAAADAAAARAVLHGHAEVGAGEALHGRDGRDGHDGSSPPPSPGRTQRSGSLSWAMWRKRS